MGGVFVASIASGFSSAYLITFLTTLLIGLLLFYFRISHVAFLLLTLIGSGYYFIFTNFAHGPEPIFGKKVELTGVVREAEQRLNSQKLVVDKIQITAPRYPEFQYGDLIKATGTIKEPEAEFAGYFKKEGIAGLMQFPQIEVVANNRGFWVKKQLLGVRHYIENVYKRVLPLEKAVFLSGLTLGSTNEFSDEFKEKLRLSGTSHLVALSGYNIAIIVSAVSLLLGTWAFTKRFNLFISVAVIALFVVMTGAEASVVRAAIMAFLVILADKLQRMYYFRNSVAAAALVMTAINPNLLAFDIGFQLSFAALLGIVYLAPWLKEKFPFLKKPSFLSWREHFANTSSAQLAVLPLLLWHFSFFSPLGIISNILILEFVPITMALGFLIAGLSLFSGTLAWIVSFPANALLSWKIGVINLCSKIASLFL